MSIFRFGLRILKNVRRIELQKVVSLRNISQTSVCVQETNLNKQSAGEKPIAEPIEHVKLDIYNRSDRSQKIPVELSIKYLQSDAYKQTYGTDPVWKLYRRNHKGHYTPNKTRKTCIRNNVIATSNPCPICRDPYLVLDYRNVLLIQQFISIFNGEIISFKKTGICQRQHMNLLIAIENAKCYGTISFEVPFVKYDYSEWNEQLE